jgi:hypothetical protein
VPELAELLLALLDALLLELLDALLLELDDVEPPVPLPLTDAIEGVPAPVPQKPHSTEAPAASVAFQPRGTAANWPDDGVVVTFHALLSEEPLSATTTRHEEIEPPLTFFTVTFAQYPPGHCDCILRSADRVESALLRSLSSATISSSS